MDHEVDPALDGLALRSEEFAERYDDVTQELVRRCPVARTEEGWLLTRYDDVHAALNDWQTYTSGSEMGVSVWRPKNKHNYKPLEVDPPLHGKFRRPFQRLFAPGSVAAHEPAMRALARELVQRIAVAGGGEIAEDFARPFVGIVFFREFLGLPTDEAEHFTELVHEMLNGPVGAQDDGYDRFIQRIDEILRAHDGDSTSEFVATLMNLEIDGEAISWEDRKAVLAVFIIGGLDTTVFAITSALHHLTRSPEDRARLVETPALVVDAVEEVLRLWSPAWILGRTAREDVEVCGRMIEAGERVIVSFGVANRDPSRFDDPMTFQLQREARNHIAFGAGPHRCIGAHLARAEIRIALEEFLAAIPDFVERPGTTAEWTTTSVRGVSKCHIDVLDGG